jgi:uncharacterized membrane protein
MSSRLRFQVDRIAFFSDAVLAIAMTLMVIEVKPPHIAHLVSDKEALMELGKLIPMFTGVILSFVFIGMFWFRHHKLMKHVENYTPKLMRLNMVFLLSVIFIPFSTAFVFENITTPSKIPIIVYNINYIVATILIYRLFAYILNPANSIISPDDLQRISDYRFELFYAIGVYTLVIAISFISAPFAGVGYAAFALERVFGKKKIADPDALLTEKVI